MSAKRVDRNAGSADLTQRPWRIGVVAHQGGHVEGGGESGATVAEDLLEAGVGVFCGSEAGEHAHRPQARSVAGRVETAGEGVLPREWLVAVDGVDRHPRHRLEWHVAQMGGVVVLSPTWLFAHTGPPNTLTSKYLFVGYCT